MAAWITSPADASVYWTGAEDLDPELLTRLLRVAQQQVTAYAPALTPDENGDTTIPDNYVLAQVMQARNMWNSTQVDPSSGAFGEDTFQIRPFPLDWMIKQILRPKRALPVIW